VTIIVGIDLQPGNTIDARWPIGLDQILRRSITDSETHIDERTVPMNNAPRVLCTGVSAGMADKSQERENKDRQERKGRKAADGSGRLPNSQRY